jgi:cation:H+ antiporter
LDTLIILAGLVLITAGAELLVRGASKLALRLGLSPLFIGLTIVGAGTSSPELAASVTASLRGLGDIAVGNVVGSNSFNLLVILGLSALVAPIAMPWRTVRDETFWMIGAGLVPLAAWVTGGVFGRAAGVVMLVGIVAYFVLSYRTARRLGRATADQAPAGGEPAARPGLLVNGVLIVAGLGLLVVGSSMFVNSAAAIGGRLGISERVIGLTVVAAGTSLPELATSMVAALRKQSAIAVGNILGSNVFNVLGILGVSAVVRPQVLSDQMLRFDVPVMIAASCLVGSVLAGRSGIGRGWGGLLLSGYGLYLGVLLMNGS